MPGCSLILRKANGQSLRCRIEVKRPGEMRSLKSKELVPELVATGLKGRMLKVDP